MFRANAHPGLEPARHRPDLCPLARLCRRRAQPFTPRAVTIDRHPWPYDVTVCQGSPGSRPPHCPACRAVRVAAHRGGRASDWSPGLARNLHYIG